MQNYAQAPRANPAPAIEPGAPTRVDVLVVGAGVSRHRAGRRLKVLLFEQNSVSLSLQRADMAQWKNTRFGGSIAPAAEGTACN